MKFQRDDRKWKILLSTLGAVLLTAFSAFPAAGLIADRCAIAPVTLTKAALPGLATCPTCDCYWSSECGTGKTCNYSSGCTKSGKLDGTCSSGSAVVSATAEQLASAVTFWMDGYIATSVAGKDGLPDPLMVDRTAQLGLSQQAQELVRDQIFNTLDVLLGFDVALPRGNCLANDRRCLAQYRIPIEAEGARLLEAGKDGLVKAILTGQASSVDQALDIYWSRLDYEPHHTGRCYPHGHEGHPVTPLDCQKDELGRIAAALLSMTASK